MSLAEKFKSIAENTKKIYDSGKNDGYALLWDTVMKSCTSSRYLEMFKGNAWNDETFNPPYDLVLPAGACQRYFEDTLITDFAAIFERNGVKLDTSKATNVQGLFQYSDVLTRVPEISLKSINADFRGSNLFAWCPKIHTVDKLILSPRTDAYYDLIFAGCHKLVNIVFEGTLYSSLSISYSSELSVDSMKSVINTLADYSGTDSEFTNTLTLHEEAWARLEGSGLAPTGTTWKEYVTTLGWLT